MFDIKQSRNVQYQPIGNHLMFDINLLAKTHCLKSTYWQSHNVWQQAIGNAMTHWFKSTIWRSCNVQHQPIGNHIMFDIMQSVITHCLKSIHWQSHNFQSNQPITWCLPSTTIIDVWHIKPIPILIKTHLPFAKINSITAAIEEPQQLRQKAQSTRKLWGWLSWKEVCGLVSDYDCEWWCYQ